MAPRQAPAAVIARVSPAARVGADARRPSDPNRTPSRGTLSRSGGGRYVSLRLRPAHGTRARKPGKEEPGPDREVAIHVGRRARCSRVDGVSGPDVFGSLDAVAAGLVA